MRATAGSTAWRTFSSASVYFSAGGGEADAPRDGGSVVLARRDARWRLQRGRQTRERGWHRQYLLLDLWTLAYLRVSARWLRHGPSGRVRRTRATATRMHPSSMAWLVAENGPAQCSTDAHLPVRSMRTRPDCHRCTCWLLVGPPEIACDDTMRVARNAPHKEGAHTPRRL